MGFGFNYNVNNDGNVTVENCLFFNNTVLKTDTFY